MTAADRRWDNDRRGRGVAAGRWIAPGVRRLLGALAEPAWVAEDPDAHLLPHLRRACEAAGSPWRLTGTAFRDGVYVVALAWARPDPRLHLLRADAFALIGAVAEGATFVEQRIGEGAIEFHVATGMRDGDSPFKGHGHLLRLRVGGPGVARLLRSRP
jgi:hypothetical protein